MAIKYKVKVVNCTYLNVRNKAGTGGKIVSVMKKGDTAVVDKVTTLSSGAKWMRISGTNTWCCQKLASGTTYLKIVEDLLKKTGSTSTKSTSKASTANKNAKTTTSSSGNSTKNRSSSSVSSSGIPTSADTKVIYSTGNMVLHWEDVQTYHPGSNPFELIDHYGNFPTEANGYEMVYSSDITDALDTICKNLNVPNAYTAKELNKNYHLNFNRFKIGFPDIYMKNTIPVIFFTRPDLNLFTSGGLIGDIPVVNSQIAKDPRIHSILLKDIKIGQLLTQGCAELKDHNFNPLLSNLAESLEIQDDSVDLLETGETFTGYKMQYSKHNIKSITSGTLNIKFKETFDMAILNTHQIWVDYQSNVFRGIFAPKQTHIYNRELDYACNIYYFLLDQDFETIRFWSKYYGVFPNNVPKSTFSYDFGSQVQFPELTVTYSYIYKEDLSPSALVEFNQDSNNKSYDYLVNYEPTVDHGGRTWVGVPFVESYTYDNGVNTNAEGFKLRWRAMGDGEAAVNGIKFSNEYESPRGNKPATATTVKTTTKSSTKTSTKSTKKTSTKSTKTSTKTSSSKTTTKSASLSSKVGTTESAPLPTNKPWEK